MAMRDFPQAWRRTAVVVTAIFMLSGCVTVSHHTGKGLAKDERARRVLVLPPDVELSILHAGGIEEPNAEWTRLARRHIADDLGRRFREIKYRSSTATAYPRKMPMTRMSYKC